MNAIWCITVLKAGLITTNFGTFINISAKVDENIDGKHYRFGDYEIAPIKLDKSVSSHDQLRSAIIKAVREKMENEIGRLKFTSVSVDMNEKALCTMVHDITATEHNVSINSVFARLANDEPPVYAHNPLLKLVDDLYGED